MEMFDPRYQLEAEEPLRSSLRHEDIQHTLQALDRLARNLRRRAAARHRRRLAVAATTRRQGG